MVSSRKPSFTANFVFAGKISIHHLVINPIILLFSDLETSGGAKSVKPLKKILPLNTMIYFFTVAHTTVFISSKLFSQGSIEQDYLSENMKHFSATLAAL